MCSFRGGQRSGLKHTDRAGHEALDQVSRAREMFARDFLCAVFELSRRNIVSRCKFDMHKRRLFDRASYMRCQKALRCSDVCFHFNQGLGYFAGNNIVDLARGHRLGGDFERPLLSDSI